MSNAIAEVEATLTGADQWAVVQLPASTFNVSVAGTWAGTITLQRSFDGANWYDIYQFTASGQKVGDDPEQGIHYRIGFKSGEYISGNAVVRISQ